MSNLIDRHPYESWLELGKPNMYRNARQKVVEILDTPQLDPLPEKVLARLDEILLAADKELSEDE